MPTITIQNQVIEFPASSASPNWAPAVIEFAQAVEAALSGVAGDFDVPPQIQIVDALNGTSGNDLTGFSFPVSSVRSVKLRYAVYRTTSTSTHYEAGELEFVYNTAGGVWDMTREATGPITDASGNQLIVFNVTNTGQVQFALSTLPGINHAGKITASATALLPS